MFRKFKLKYLLLINVFTILICCKTIYAQDATAVDIRITSGKGISTANMLDNSYSTSYAISDGETLTITSKTPMKGIYIEWYKVPSQWSLTTNGKTVECGKNGFLHEYISFDDSTTEVVLNIPKGNRICDISAYSEGNLPSNVQTWKPSCQKADILVLSAHADDEVLFLGGVLAEYAGEQKLNVQIIYFSDYTRGTVIREHEKLDGLWVMGVRNYPENGNFDDIYAGNLAAAESTFGYDKTLSWVVEMIRKYKPQVCVTQDTNGEYGHGTHMLISKAMQEAVTISMDKNTYPDSANKYGTHDVAKTYIHLHPENKISLNCRKPLAAFGGQTAFDIASAAYKQHVSQQWCWFYVSDTNEYSIAEFGMCRSTVGADTGNDMMENIVSYAEQERLEKESLEQASREQASKEQASIEAEKQSIAESQAASKEQASKEQASIEAARRKQEQKDTFTTVVIVIISLIVLAAISLIAYVTYMNRKIKRRRRRRRR